MPPPRCQVEIAPAAERQFDKLPRDAQRRILPAIVALADNPRPPGCRKLARADDIYRIAVGNFRILYRIEKNRLVVLVVKIGDRKDVYRRF